MESIHAAVSEHVHNHWVELIFAAGFVIAIIVDFILVYLKKTTISMRVWMICYAHPTVQGFGVMVSIGACFLLRHSWPSVMVAGAQLGHLFLTNEYSASLPP